MTRDDGQADQTPAYVPTFVRTFCQGKERNAGRGEDERQGINLLYLLLLVNRLAPGRGAFIVIQAMGSPMGLRGRPDADDPMNLIRIMPAEGGASSACARRYSSPMTSGEFWKNLL
jgi:hypothetical protein